ncbi:hypothetical protein KHM83_15415 [Fusibacter paucivorans]|uniref:Uncharacterized protein n=1 Tax=Fusibacter paucivorans TaxID=76009 RepID=A0ABS5PSD9_9FIRM|nr:hypothetical protein [Fusibacter paucivorans]MBS7528074.1 hypothetical protein [Fusibacter paucivorans]
MTEIRDIIYLNYDKKSKRLISYGIEFYEFIESLSVLPEHLLILEGGFGTHFNMTTLSEYCGKDDIEDLKKEDIYSYGNFSWIDFETVHGLESLSAQEVAEIFYVSKMWQPLNSTYFEPLNNRFIYNAHDDGWINHVYYNDMADLKAVIETVIRSKLKRICHRTSKSLSQNVIDDLVSFAQEGFAIDFKKVLFEDDSIRLPLELIGKHLDMDEVYAIVNETDLSQKTVTMMTIQE